MNQFSNPSPRSADYVCLQGHLGGAPAGRKGAWVIFTALMLILQATSLVAQELSAALEWAVVNHPRNPSLADGSGTVPHAFRISKYEITNLQYKIFLNKVARKDPHQLYDTRMQTEPCGGIERFIEEGECHYRLREGFARQPVVYVSYFSAMRFVNWMHNGHTSTETETGAYDLRVEQAPRMPDARYWIPTENEWIKAGHFDPLKGTQGGYWLYPTGTDTLPAESLSSTILGGTSRPRHGLPSAAGLAWFSLGRSVLLPNEPWVGAPSPFGTFHQGGNVAEWVDGWLDVNHAIRLQITRGGAWDSSGESLTYDKIELHPRTFVSASIGFRIASRASQETPLAQSMR
jgi:formylglycine-generating enzyme required for sulfatase activity